jgi:hypothetical protein
LTGLKMVNLVIPAVIACSGVDEDAGQVLRFGWMSRGSLEHGGGFLEDPGRCRRYRGSGE